jgi:phage head maturation protease
MKKSPKNTVQTRLAHVRADGVDTENRTVEFVISTEAVDSYGTVFKADGWNFTRYNANPVVFYQHATHSVDPDTVIGTSEVRVENGQVIGVVTFEPADINPLAEKILRKINHGTLRGASIHADVEEGRWGEKDAGEDPDVIYFTRQHLLEWSVVGVNSNPEALKRNTEAIDSLKQSIKVDGPEEIATEKNENMSTFDAQLIINQNL